MFTPGPEVWSVLLGAKMFVQYRQQTTTRDLRAGSPRSRVTKSTIEGLLISACPDRFAAFAARILAAVSGVLCGLLYIFLGLTAVGLRRRSIRS